MTVQSKFRWSNHVVATVEEKSGSSDPVLMSSGMPSAVPACSVQPLLVLHWDC